MGMSYEETLKDIESNFGFVPAFVRSFPEDVLVHEWPRMKKYEIEKSEIPEKYRALIGLAVAGSTKCPYCVYHFKTEAGLLGASDKEIAETAALAGMISDLSTMIHATNQDLQQFKTDTDAMAEKMRAKMQVAP